MRAKIDCVAVTDHNSGDWIERLQIELASLTAEQPSIPGYRPIHILPGVELTASDGLHILAIYDPSDGVAKIHGIKALAQCDDHSNNAESMCTQGAAAICEHIRTTGGVAVLAHAEEVNGIFFGTVDSATGQFLPKRGPREIAQVLNHVDAIEVHDPTHPAYKHFAKEAKAFSLVDGSDAHHTSSAGARWVWLKMARPNIEGLKLALLDPESSVIRPSGKAASAPPSPPRRRITSLSVKEILLRRPVLDTKFSPWFNSLIGGRGSGKSTMLEALRLALAREHELDELGAESDVLRTFRKFRQVGGARGNAGMLRQETEISATVEKYDAGLTETYVFKWTQSDFEVRRMDETGNWALTGLTADQASTLFPVKVFSQKQIFELADRPSALLTYIDSAPEVGFERWQMEHERLRLQLRLLRTSERTLKQVIAKRPQFETELKEITRKTLAYQLSHVADQVKVFREHQQARKTIESYMEDVTAPLNTLESAIITENPFETANLGELTIQKPEPTLLREATVVLKKDLVANYESVRQAIGVIRQRIAIFQALPVVVSFLAEVDGAMSAYRTEVDKLKSEGVSTAQEAEVALKRKQELESELAKVSAQEAELADTYVALLRAYVELKHHRRLLTKLRQRFVDSVLGGDALLRITIEGQSDIEQSMGEFRALLRIQDGTFIDDVYSTDALLDEPTGILGKLVAPRLCDPTHKRVTSLKLGLLERNREILGYALHGKLLTALGRLSPDDDDALLEWFPQDRVRVEFRRAGTGDFQSLERASAGQKTSAILSFLLAHGDEPLLLDQPEDDLDNALVYELVVRQIRTNKSRRQIIVVTHNPNIVVNGDAELVLPMSFEGGQINIKNAGGLQERLVRERICEVMEGGREAFRQRYKRILEDLDATR